MKKHCLIAFILLLAGVLSAGEGIAVLSGGAGQTEFHRDGRKKPKPASGTLLESSDELRTGDGSHLGFKFADGSASLRMFSNSRLLVTGAYNGGKLVKKAALTKGSAFVRIASDSTGFSFSTVNSVITPNASTFLVKLTPQGETQVSVLQGQLVVNAPAAQAMELVGAGRTAVITSDGRFSVRDTFDSDINAEQLAAIEPATPSVPQSLTIPLVDPQGKVKYVEISW